jgi:hypothetical protein
MVYNLVSCFLYLTRCKYAQMQSSGLSGYVNRVIAISSVSPRHLINSQSHTIGKFLSSSHFFLCQPALPVNLHNTVI